MKGVPDIVMVEVCFDCVGSLQLDCQFDAFDVRLSGIVKEVRILWKSSNI
jgi:hypothetical protein